MHRKKLWQAVQKSKKERKQDLTINVKYKLIYKIYMNINTSFMPRSFNKIYTHTLQIFKNFIETNLDWISGVTSHSICIHYFITSILMSFDFRGHLWPIRPFDGNSNVQNTETDCIRECVTCQFYRLWVFFSSLRLKNTIYDMNILVCGFETKRAGT